jgi:hypothetical protein
MNKPVKRSRTVIYIKDIMMITGRQYRAARYLYQAILRHFGKRKGHVVTCVEFSIYMGIDEETVISYLIN